MAEHDEERGPRRVGRSGTPPGPITASKVAAVADPRLVSNYEGSRRDAARARRFVRDATGAPPDPPTT